MLTIGEIVVVQAEHVEAADVEPSIAPSVVTCPSAMVWAVDLYDERCLYAEEIDDIGSKRLLPTELRTQIAVTQNSP